MKTAMQQLLTQMREERNKLPMPIEWDRAYQAIEMMIQNTYIPLEREQIINAADYNFSYINNGYTTLGQLYYNETFGDKK